MSRFRAAVFLDRDGTVIEEKHYLSTPEGVRLLPGVGAAIAALNRADVAAVLVTNQSGVARGYFDEATVLAIHARLEADLKAEGAQLDALFWCPHLADAQLEPYRQVCGCRKPAPGMVEQARQALELDGLPTFVVGDKEVDLDLGRRCGAISILVRTGYGAKVEAQLSARQDLPERVEEGLKDAIDWILAYLDRSGFVEPDRQNIPAGSSVS